MDQQPPAADPAEDPVQALQQTLAQICPESMVVGFATVVEWLEPDGSTTMSVLHSPMPPWHMYGLLTYARDNCDDMMPILIDGCDDDDDDF